MSVRAWWTACRATLLVAFAIADSAAAGGPTSAPATPGPTTVVEGQVFDHLGAGVKDAKITASRPAEGQTPERKLATATTDETGDFRLLLPGKVSGKIVVEVRRTGYTPATREVEIDPDDPLPPFVDIELSGSAVLTGVVRDARTKQPVHGATIRVGTSFRDWTEQSEADGTFRIAELPPGPAGITVDAAGYGREQSEVESLAQAEPLTILLKPERIAHLKVTNEHDQPVAGAVIECLDEARHDFRTLTTDEQGRADLRGLHFDTRELSLRLSHDQYVSSDEFDRTLVLPEEPLESEHVFVLAAAGIVTGTVTESATGDPLNGARVVVGEDASNATLRGWTDFAGHYRVSGVRPGRQPVTVHLRGYAPELFEVDVAAGQTTTRDVALAAGKSVGGVVVDASGKPLADAHVMAVRWRGHETLGLQALTDEQGRFVIADAPLDEFLVTLQHPAQRALVDQKVQAPKTDYRFEMTARLGGSDALPGVTVKAGDPAPEIEVVTLEGKTLRTADLKGKTVLLDFWATWCGPCVGEIPNLQAVQAAFGQRNDFLLLSISLDQDEKTLREFVGKRKLNWSQAVGAKNGAEKAADAFGVEAIPALFLIGPDGKVRTVGLRGPAIQQAVGKVLNEQGAE